MFIKAIKNDVSYESKSDSPKIFTSIQKKLKPVVLQKVAQNFDNDDTYKIENKQ